MVVPQRVETVPDGPGERLIVAQRGGEAEFAAVVRGAERRQLLRDLLRREIEHTIGKALRIHRVAVVQLLRLQHKYRAGTTAVLFTARVKLLHALLRHADQIAVVPVRIVGVAGEMRADGLDAVQGVAAQIYPVAVAIGHSSSSFTPSG